MTVNISEFKKDLLALMIKHNIDIMGVTMDDCSDTYGIYGEKFIITDNSNNDYTLCEGDMSIDKSDLR